MYIADEATRRSSIRGLELPRRDPEMCVHYGGPYSRYPRNTSEHTLHKTEGAKMYELSVTTKRMSLKLEGWVELSWS